LVGITRAIQYQFACALREEMGTQNPVETLASRSSNCRDFALFMTDAARSVGFAARFVSGYLYDGRLIGAKGRPVGGGATHAWVQIYLAGAGWVEFDPTNKLVGGEKLIRVAVVRTPSQALPLSGTFIGAPNDLLGMSADVTMMAEWTTAPPPPIPAAVGGAVRHVSLAARRQSMARG